MDISLPFFKIMKKEDKLLILSSLLENLHADNGLNEKELMGLYNKTVIKTKAEIPLSIFVSGLTPTQAVVKFLRENCKFKLVDVSQMLNRDQRGIWCSYDKVKRKKSLVKEGFQVPVEIFSDRRFSVFESLTKYLSELNYSTFEISKLLRKKKTAIQNTLSKVRRKNEL
jgi:hypothetical protein